MGYVEIYLYGTLASSAISGRIYWRCLDIVGPTESRFVFCTLVLLYGDLGHRVGTVWTDAKWGSVGTIVLVTQCYFAILRDITIMVEVPSNTTAGS